MLKKSSFFCIHLILLYNLCKISFKTAMLTPFLAAERKAASVDRSFDKFEAFSILKASGFIQLQRHLLPMEGRLSPGPKRLN